MLLPRGDLAKVNQWGDFVRAPKVQSGEGFLEFVRRRTPVVNAESVRVKMEMGEKGRSRKTAEDGCSQRKIFDSFPGQKMGYLEPDIVWNAIPEVHSESKRQERSVWSLTSVAMSPAELLIWITAKR
jgi:hypothetical protein